MSATIQEQMAIAMSRELRDNEVVLTGAASAVPLAASLLAQRSHAPGLTVLGAGVYINPQRLVPEFSAGWDCRPTAVGDLGDVFAITELGIDVMFYGGMQIDEFGCVNVHEVATPKGPLRGPGMANTMLGHTAKRTILFTSRHEPRTLVSAVDFASVIGHARRGRTRSELGLPNGGPAALFTPAVLMRPNAEGAFRPDLTFDDRPWQEVLAGTGWAIDEQRPPRFYPTEEELTLLRSSVDPDGLLRAQG